MHHVSARHGARNRMRARRSSFRGARLQSLWCRMRGAFSCRRSMDHRLACRAVAIRSRFSAGPGLRVVLAFGTGVVRRIGQAEERSEEHTSELQSLMRISYSVFCLNKKQMKLLTQ